MEFLIPAGHHDCFSCGDCRRTEIDRTLTFGQSKCPGDVANGIEERERAATFNGSAGLGNFRAHWPGHIFELIDGRT